MLTNPARTSSTEFGNGSNSWKWQKPSSSLSGAGQARQGYDQGYDDQDAYQQAQPPVQPSGSFRRSTMLPVPYQDNRRAWGQEDDETAYGDMDDQNGSASNLPVPMGANQGSSAFPMLSEEMLANRLPPGRKPPAFIPATRPRRPYRLSRYRVVSGTISIGLMLLLIIGAGSFLAVRAGAFQKLFAGKSLPPFSYHFPQPTMPVLSATPQATPSGNQAAQSIGRVTTAKNYSATYDPLNITTTFKPGETVNVLWQVHGAKANDVISIKWYQNGTAINGLGDQNTKETFAKDGNWNGVFGLAYPTASLGTAELYYNGQLGWTIQFIVADAPPATKTPAPSTTPSNVPTQTPTH